MGSTQSPHNFWTDAGPAGAIILAVGAGACVVFFCFLYQKLSSYCKKPSSPEGGKNRLLTQSPDSSITYGSTQGSEEKDEENPDQGPQI